MLSGNYWKTRKLTGYASNESFHWWGHTEYYPFRLISPAELNNAPNHLVDPILNALWLLYANRVLYWECLAALIGGNKIRAESNRVMYFFLKHASRSTKHGIPFKRDPATKLWTEDFVLKNLKWIQIRSLHRRFSSHLFDILSHCTRLEYIRIPYCKHCRMLRNVSPSLLSKVRTIGDRVNKRYPQRMLTAAYANCAPGNVTTKHRAASDATAHVGPSRRYLITNGPHPRPAASWVHEVRLFEFPDNGHCGCCQGPSKLFLSTGLVSKLSPPALYFHWDKADIVHRRRKSTETAPE